MTALFRKYRPHDFSYFVGHERTKRAVQMMAKRGTLGGKAFWISGPSGIGKTTLAYLMAGQVCDPENFEEFDAGQFTPKDIDELERRLRSRCLGEMSGRAVILNEAHGLRQDTIRKLLVTLERIPSHVVWLMTSTDLGRDKLFKDIDAHPLLSRCIKFDLKVDDYADPMVKRAMAIAEQEGLGGADVTEWVALCTACKWNFRDVLTEVEKGVMMRDVAEAEAIPVEPVAAVSVTVPTLDFEEMMAEMFAGSGA
jgi:replication-associated recombination protein RarA